MPIPPVSYTVTATIIPQKRAFSKNESAYERPFGNTRMAGVAGLFDELLLLKTEHARRDN